jgi:transcriptional regulator with XRE-family HTH domain
MTENKLLQMIGLQIREWRKDAKMTQQDLAKKAGMTQADISGFERKGGRISGFYRIQRLVESTGHSLSELVLKMPSTNND